MLVAAWVLVARWLWRTTVPAGLHLPHVRASSVLGRADLRRTADYNRVADLLWILATLAGLGAAAGVALRRRSLAERIGIGRVGTGVVLAALVATVSAGATLPFALAFAWWDRHHGLSRETYASVVAGAWQAAIAEALLLAFVVAVAMGLALRVGRLWWAAAAPVFVGLVAVFSLAAPYLTATHPLAWPLRSDARTLERATGTSGTPMGVEDVHARTSAANAYSVGFGPSRRVVLWDTLLRFPRREVRVVMAHELGHVARGHVWKGVVWFALFLVPLLALLAEVMRRVGGIATPASIPLALFAALMLALLARPAENVVSRRYEADADWVALTATRDPTAARGLFRRFATVDLAQPRPPTWDYVLLEDHPTIAQRIAMAKAWAARNAKR